MTNPLSHKEKVALDKQERIQKVIEAAVVVFDKDGIDNAKISDIAKEAGIGVASIYRYFKAKPDIVIATGIWYWEKEVKHFIDHFTSEAFDVLNGYDQMEEILGIFKELGLNHASFLGFLEQFDNYIVKESVELSKLEDYEKSVLNIKPFIISAVNKGIKDDTIKASVDANIYYMTVMHSMMSLCQKLILRGAIIPNDLEVSFEDQVDMAKDMALTYIKN